MAIGKRIDAERADSTATAGRLSMDENVQRARAIAEAQAMARQATEAPVARSAVADRVPFGVLEQALAHAPVPGFRLYWFNDIPGRIARAKKAGYEFVADADSGEPLARNVGRGESGRGQTAFLMKIPIQWYYEDMSAAQALRDRTLRDIKEGRHGAVAGQNQYVPADRPIRIDEQR